MPENVGAIDPGQREEDVSEEELAKEEEARTEVTVQEMVERDLDDSSTPSRRGPSGDPEPHSFDVLVRERRKESTGGG